MIPQVRLAKALDLRSCTQTPTYRRPALELIQQALLGHLSAWDILQAGFPAFTLFGLHDVTRHEDLKPEEVDNRQQNYRTFERWHGNCPFQRSQRSRRVRATQSKQRS